MNSIGKFLGFLLGGIKFGPLGSLIGLFLGHLIDKAIHPDTRTHERAQTTFFNATFLVMGHIAKADGRVSEAEIERAKVIMEKMGLTSQQRQRAIALFNEGKLANFSLTDCLKQLRKDCHQHQTLLRLFLDIQTQASYAEKVASKEQKAILQHVCQILGFAPLNFHLLDALYAQSSSHSYQHYSYSHRTEDTRSRLEESYALLNIKKTATDAEVKRAYRKLMSQHHPDKLVAKGLPEEMIKIATEKTQRIQKAYENIRQARGMT